MHQELLFIHTGCFWNRDQDLDQEEWVVWFKEGPFSVTAPEQGREEWVVYPYFRS